MEVPTVHVGIKLEGVENWSLWRFQVREILIGLDLCEVVEGTNKIPVEGEEAIRQWKVCDAKARLTIVSRLSDRVMKLDMNCNTASEFWSKLLNVYD